MWKAWVNRCDGDGKGSVQESVSNEALEKGQNLLTVVMEKAILSQLVSWVPVMIVLRLAVVRHVVIS